MKEVERHEVGQTSNGCKVFVVRRHFGPFARESYGERAGRPNATYWTTIVQTKAGGEKTMAADSGRWFGYEPQHGRKDATRAAQAWIKAQEFVG
jgi:hypothetical protein